MKPEIMPGEDPQDLILYVNDNNKDRQPYYGLDLLMLICREGQYYIYSEKGWITSLSVSDVTADYEPLPDEYFKHHTILEFEVLIEERYDLTLPYSLIYNNALAQLMISDQDEATLKRSAAIYDQLIDQEEQLIGSQVADSGDLKRAISFYRWKYLILSVSGRMTRDCFEIQRISELLAMIGDDQDLFTAESYEMIGDHYSEYEDDEKAARYFDQALKILGDHVSEDQHPINRVIVLSKLADSQKKLGKNQAALDSYEEAIRQLAPMIHHEENLMVQLAALYQDSGRLMEADGKTDEAQIAYTNELKELAKVQKLYPTKENEHNYVIGLHNIASFFKKIHHLKEALRYYHQAIDAAYAYEKRYAHVETSLLLGELYHEIGLAYLELHDPLVNEQGFDYLKKNIEICHQRFIQSHLQQQGLSYGAAIGELAQQYEQCGDSRMYDAYREEMSVFDQLAQYYPNQLNFHNHLIVNRIYARALYHSLDEEKTAAAIRILESDIAECRMKADDEAYQEDLVQSLYVLGSFYVTYGEDELVKSGLSMLEEAYGLTHDQTMKDLCGEALAKVYVKGDVDDQKKAYAFYREMLNHPHKADYDLGHAYENMAYYYHMTKDDAQSLHYHEKELAVFKQLYESSQDEHDYHNYLIALKQLSDTAIRVNTPESLKRALTVLKERYARTKALYDENRANEEDVGRVLESLGLVYYRLGHAYYDEAKTAYDQAYVYLNQKEDRFLAALEGRRGNLAELAHHYDEAYHYYQHQYAIMKKLYKKEHTPENEEELITALHNIGAIEMTRHHYEKSIKALREELKYRVDRYHQGDEKQRVKIGACHRYLGENFQKLNNNHEALTQYKIFHYYSADDPHLAAIALEKMGNIYRQEQNGEGLLAARECYREVYDYIEKNGTEKSLVVIIQKLAYVCFALGPDYYDEAMTLYQEQEKILKKMCEKDDRYEADYAICLNNEAVILKQDDPNTALKLFEKAAALTKKHELTPMRLLRLGNIYRMMGDLTHEKADYEQALQCFEKCSLQQSSAYIKACQKALESL